MPKIAIELEAETYGELAKLLRITGESMAKFIEWGETYGPHADAAMGEYLRSFVTVHDLRPDPRGKITYTPNPTPEEA